MLAYDWHSSGVTTVVAGVLKTALSPLEHGIAVCGGKDGVPYPLERKAMDQSIEILGKSVEAARIGEKDKLRSLQSLRRFVPQNANS